MRVSWEPSSAARSAVLSGGMVLANDTSAAGGSCGSSFDGHTPAGPSTTLIAGPSRSSIGHTAPGPSRSCLEATPRMNKSLPVHGSTLSPVSEVKQLRTEVARLRAAGQRDAKERETLHGMVDRLKTELRHALDENRSLTDGIEERKQVLDAQSARREAAARESALNSAKDLFKSMLEEAENGRAGTENRNSNRDQTKLPSHKLRPLAAAWASPPSDTAVHGS